MAKDIKIIKEDKCSCRLCGKETSLKNAFYLIYVDGCVCPECLEKCNEEI